MIKNIIAGIFALACLYFCYLLSTENANLKNAMEKYKVANGGNIGRDRIKINHDIYNNIEFETGVPKELLQSFGIYENLADNYAFGIKRIPTFIIIKHSVNEYQPRALARIMTQEAFLYIMAKEETRKAFLIQLTERYCKSNKQYGRELDKIYCEVINK